MASQPDLKLGTKKEGKEISLAPLGSHRN